MKRFLFAAIFLFTFVSSSFAGDPESGISVSSPATVQRIFLPEGYLFKPLIADQKQPRFYVSYRRYSFHDDTINAAAVGYGEIFGLYRSVDEFGDGWQVGFGGGLFAQFNLDAPSHDLVNADYTVGVPVDWKRGPIVWRISIYHQSSHLGDEFLLRTNPERVELSYEALNVLGARTQGAWRFYGGGETLVHKEPHDLKPLSLQTGLEYRSPDPLIGRGNVVAGIDLKSYQEHDWAVNGTINGGLEFGGDPPANRYLRVVLEGYKGFAPHGQFYSDRISYYGIGVYLGY